MKEFNVMRILVLIIILFFFSLPAFPQIKANKYKDYKGIVGTMKALAKFDGKGRSKNTIYVSDILNDGNRDYAYAYWVEDNAIYSLHLPLSLPLKKNSPDYYWLTYKARVDLKTDVVETEEEIAGSSYLVDRAWVNKIIKSCKRGILLHL